LKLSQVMSGLNFEGQISDKEITAVVSDSRKIQEGCVFVCIKGASFDGHSEACKAAENGAVAVVSERPTGAENELIVDNTRMALAVMCQNFFGNPQDKLKLIAVTGTNGKTTVTTVIKQALENLGYKSGLIGTVRCEIGDIAVPAKFTTPEPWDLYSLMARMVSAGCSYLVMEASSQALDQGRLNNLIFDCAVFTNLSQDHLDYHKTMDAYFEAKKKLFLNAKAAAINVDDERGLLLAKELEIPLITYSSRSDSSTFTAKNVEFMADGVKFMLNAEGFISRVKFPMPGAFSVENALSAVCAMIAVGIDKDLACSALSKVRGVKGRCEVLHRGEATVICDFAHTADALLQLHAGMKPFVEGRLVTLFGCAGDRDPIKRPAMVEAVAKFSDYIVVTSDNPRTEDPGSIIDSIKPYLDACGKPYTAIIDRHRAIRWALDNLKPGDVLLLCGKGHEDYQVIDGCTIYLDEHRIVDEYYSIKG